MNHKLLTTFYFRLLQRQPNPSSSSGYSKSGPYQSQLYDSWKTEWNAPYTEHYRSGPSGAPSRGSSAEMVPTAQRPKGSSSYMTKGGRRLAYDDDFWLKMQLFVKKKLLRTFKKYPFREKSVHVQWATTTTTTTTLRQRKESLLQKSHFFYKRIRTLLLLPPRLLLNLQFPGKVKTRTKNKEWTF